MSEHQCSRLCDAEIKVATVGGATAVIMAVMPNGCRAGFIEECSLPTGWTEDGKEISGRAAYDLQLTKGLTDGTLP